MRIAGVSNAFLFAIVRKFGTKIPEGYEIFLSFPELAAATGTITQSQDASRNGVALRCIPEGPIIDIQAVEIKEGQSQPPPSFPIPER